jgi:hypothetical protein
MEVNNLNRRQDLGHYHRRSDRYHRWAYFRDSRWGHQGRRDLVDLILIFFLLLDIFHEQRYHICRLYIYRFVNYSQYYNLR